jgi:hypothetical protein
MQRWSAGAERAVRTLLRAMGREVVVRVRVGGADADAQEVKLKPCVLRVKGEAAELVVAASALRGEGGALVANEVFATSSRVVDADVVWRVVGYAPVEGGGRVVAWRVQLAR